MKAVKLSTLKKGDFFTLKPIEEPSINQVYVRDDYDRSLKKYDSHKFTNVSSSYFFKGDKLVYVDFYF